MVADVSEEERQALLLALAILALDRPGWAFLLEQIAAKFAGQLMFHEFKQLNADRRAASPPRPLG